MKKKLIDSHIVRGQEILLSINGIPEDVSQLVFEHYEDVAGLGYPMRNDIKTHHPLSKILQLADSFVTLALVGPHNVAKTGHKAIMLLESRYSGRYDEKTMTALKLVFRQ